MANNSLTFNGRIRSFRCAFSGIRVMIFSQQNAWIHAFATVIVVIFGINCGLTKSEWCWIILAAIAVWTAEALNTAFEFLTVPHPTFIRWRQRQKMLLPEQF